MKQHRFIGSFDLAQTHLEVHDQIIVHQIARVLKLQEGEEIILCDGAGTQAVALLERVSNHSLGLQMLSVSPDKNEPRTRVTLYASILKHESFEYVVQKATEVGIAAIVPVISARTVKRAVRMARAQQIAKEAAEQSGRGMVPMIAEPLEFERAIAHANTHERNFFFDVGATQFSNHAYSAYTSAGIWIGPEGGWEEYEAARARAAEYTIAGLGSLTLRAETAAVIASYVVIHTV